MIYVIQIHSPLFSEDIVSWFEADNEEEAIEKAKQMVANDEVAYGVIEDGPSYAIPG